MEAKQCASNPYYQSKQKPAHKGAAAKCSIHSQIPLIPMNEGEKDRSVGWRESVCGYKTGNEKNKKREYRYDVKWRNW